MKIANDQSGDNAAPLRVAHVIGKMCHGGVESVVFNYYRHMNHDRIQFDIYYDSDSTAAPPADLLDAGAMFFEVPPYQKLAAYLKNLKRSFAAGNYKIVHSHLNALSMFPLSAAQSAGVPVRIAHSHSTSGRGEPLLTIAKNVLRPFSKRYATDYWACSRQAGIWLFGKEAYDRGEVTVINNAIDLDRFMPNPMLRDEMRREHGLADKFVVGHVGRFCPQKNQLFLVDVFAEIKDMRPEAHLVLVGDGPLMSSVKEKVANTGLADSVSFVGASDRVEAWYNAMDLLVFPSRYEGLSVVLLEAQAMGVPVICSDVITEEAVIVPDEVTFMPLLASARNWAQSACHVMPLNITGDRGEILANRGFDITKEAIRLQRLYWRLRVNTMECLRHCQGQT